VLGEFGLLFGVFLDRFLEGVEFVLYPAQRAFLLRGVKRHGALIGLKAGEGFLERLEVDRCCLRGEQVRCGGDHVAFEQGKHLADEGQDGLGDAKCALKPGGFVQRRDRAGQGGLRGRGSPIDRRCLRFRSRVGWALVLWGPFRAANRCGFCLRSRILGRGDVPDQGFGLIVVPVPDLGSGGLGRFRELDFRRDFPNVPGRQGRIGRIWPKGIHHESVLKLTILESHELPNRAIGNGGLVSFGTGENVNPVVTRALRSLQRNILAGVITVGPLFVTWLIFSFLLSSLAKAGRPLVYVFTAIFPEDGLAQPWVQSVLAVLLTLVVLYVVGKLTSVVIGRQAFNLFESTLERLPVVAKVYTSVRQLLDSMMAKKDSNQRVVLVDFPIAGQKSIGFLTRTMVDSATGEELAAVLLPNAINPTSAFLQILPMRCVTMTDLNMEQAMSMLLTGGAVAPESLRFSHPQVTVMTEQQ
jgi:uncharacterized membrane protein